MKKYKLIKKYPGSPNLGSIYEQQPGSSFYRCGIQVMFKDYIENQEEHWKEIIEKDYEILSFYNKEGKSYYNITTQGYYYSEPASSRSFTYCSLYYQIHSIKRLSDGEIFTVGDKILGFETDKNPFEIISIFHSFDDLCFASYLENSNLKVGRSCYLSSKYPKKVKQPLFTTEDGIDIFEGDIIYMVHKFDYSLTDGIVNNKDFGCNKLRFSKKEKAEEYVLMNKPCLSINDVAKIFVSTNYITLKGKLYQQGQSLRDMVKNKLKNENNKK